MKIYKVRSETNPKKIYKVRHFDDGEFACECPKYIFSKKGYQCKHILKIKEYLKKKEENEKKKKL